MNSALRDKVSNTEVPEKDSPDKPAGTMGENLTARYQLDDQIGYLLRLANQRHLEIFNQLMPELTPTQFAVLVRLNQVGALSQNELGRQVGIDGATTNGVIDRLQKKQLIKTSADKLDKRRLRVSLTTKGEALIPEAINTAINITRETLQRLSASESRQLIRLLAKLQQ